jgi:hypothetical protein
VLHAPAPRAFVPPKVQALAALNRLKAFAEGGEPNEHGFRQIDKDCERIHSVVESDGRGTGPAARGTTYIAVAANERKRCAAIADREARICAKQASDAKGFRRQVCEASSGLAKSIAHQIREGASVASTVSPKVIPMGPCAGCLGDGGDAEDPCEDCDGTGKVEMMNPTDEEAAYLLGDGPLPAAWASATTMHPRCHACDEHKPGTKAFPSLPMCPQCAKAWKMGYRCGEEAAGSSALARYDAQVGRLRGVIGNAHAHALSAHESTANPVTKIRLSLIVRELESEVPCSRIDVHDHDGVPCVTSGCRRCSECRGENHHWLEESAPPPPNGDGFNGYVCKHCPARAEMCDGCGGAVEPEHVCEEDGGDLEVGSVAPVTGKASVARCEYSTHGEAAFVIHDERGCYAVCPTHARWRRTGCSRIGGHHRDCATPDVRAHATRLGSAESADDTLAASPLYEPNLGMKPCGPWPIPSAPCSTKPSQAEPHSKNAAPELNSAADASGPCRQCGSAPDEKHHGACPESPWPASVRADKTSEHRSAEEDTSMRATGEKPDPVGRASGMAGERSDDQEEDAGSRRGGPSNIVGSDASRPGSADSSLPPGATDLERAKHWENHGDGSPEGRAASLAEEFAAVRRETIATCHEEVGRTFVLLANSAISAAYFRSLFDGTSASSKAGES